MTSKFDLDELDIFRKCWLQFYIVDRNIFKIIPNVGQSSRYLLTTENFKKGGNHIEYRCCLLVQEFLAQAMLYAPAALELKKKYKNLFDDGEKEKLAHDLEKATGERPPTEIIETILELIHAIGNIVTANEDEIAESLFLDIWNDLGEGITEACLDEVLLRLKSLIARTSTDVDLSVINKLLFIWRKLIISLSRTPFVLTFLVSELPKVRLAFETSMSTESQINYRFSGLRYIEKFFQCDSKRIGALQKDFFDKLRKLEHEPSVCGFLELFRRLSGPADVGKTTADFQYLVWWVLNKENTLEQLFRNIAKVVPKIPDPDKIQQLITDGKILPASLFPGSYAPYPGTKWTPPSTTTMFFPDRLSPLNKNLHHQAWIRDIKDFETALKEPGETKRRFMQRRI